MLKKLVLGALITAAASTGCIISDGGNSVVTVRWSFTHLATNTVGSCQHDTDIAVIMSQPWDPETQVLFGSPIMDPFDCLDEQGTVELPDDTYLVWVEIHSDTGTLLAKSDQSYVDTLLGDAVIDAGFYDDGGYFFFSWDLINEATGARVSCRNAGITANGSVEVIATSLANSSYMKDDKFTCEDHFGVTDPLLTGSYFITVNAEENDAVVGEVYEDPHQVIVANQLTDLGNIKIQVPVR